ncbi:MAG: hypothetical protein J5449_11825 [Oscillospiraceae bacterium]|nr:hypothetical protein [Oscillospiraceae bacterium]
MNFIGAIGAGGIASAWQQPQGTAVRAAVSVSSAERQKGVNAAAAIGVAGAQSAFRPVAEMPYVPEGFGPEDLANRTRAEYPELSLPYDPNDEWVKRLGSPFGDDAEEKVMLPGEEPEEKFRTIGTPFGEEKEKEFKLPGDDKDEDEDEKGVDGVKDAKSPADVMNEEKCETCAKRKYQDGSDDPGVSFKFATRINPKAAQAAVRGHELEHVVRERAKAKMEGRKVVSQSVTYHTGICPECGKFYISGGTTRTVTAADNTKDILEELNGGSDDDFDISA